MVTTPPVSHPIVGEAKKDTEAAQKQKKKSLDNFSKKYPKLNKIWWDEKN